MSETDKIQLMADNVSLTSTVAERDAEIATHATTIEGLEKAKNDKDIEIATQATTIDTQATTIKGLEKAKNDKDIEIATLESQLASSQTSLGSAQKAASDENDNTPTWAIAIIAVIGAMFLLVLVSLGILVRR